MSDISAQAAIMVVDDVPANLKLLGDMLGERGYRVRSFTSGAPAFTAAAKNPPDLVLLDINMPGMNGFEVCERLKADAGLKEIPVIFISSLGETLDKVRAFGVGGVDYITKPFDLTEVEARIKTHLELRRQKLELTSKVEELRAALEQIKTLRGMLPICANCKKIRNDQGYWKQVEVYIAEHSDVTFTHGICPDCLRKLYPDYCDEKDGSSQK